MVVRRTIIALGVILALLLALQLMPRAAPASAPLDEQMRLVLKRNDLPGAIFFLWRGGRPRQYTYSIVYLDLQTGRLVRLTEFPSSLDLMWETVSHDGLRFAATFMPNMDPQKTGVFYFDARTRQQRTWEMEGQTDERLAITSRTLYLSLTTFNKLWALDIATGQRSAVKLPFAEAAQSGRFSNLHVNRDNQNVLSFEYHGWVSGWARGDLRPDGVYRLDTQTGEATALAFPDYNLLSDGRFVCYGMDRLLAVTRSSNSDVRLRPSLCDSPSAWEEYGGKYSVLVKTGYSRLKQEVRSVSFRLSPCGRYILVREHTERRFSGSTYSLFVIDTATEKTIGILDPDDRRNAPFDWLVRSEPMAWLSVKPRPEDLPRTAEARPSATGRLQASVALTSVPAAAPPVVTDAFATITGLQAQEAAPANSVRVLYDGKDLAGRIYFRTLSVPDMRSCIEYLDLARKRFVRMASFPGGVSPWPPMLSRDGRSLLETLPVASTASHSPLFLIDPTTGRGTLYDLPGPAFGLQPVAIGQREIYVAVHMPETQVVPAADGTAPTSQTLRGSLATLVAMDRMTGQSRALKVPLSNEPLESSDIRDLRISPADENVLTVDFRYVKKGSFRTLGGFFHVDTRTGAVAPLSFPDYDLDDEGRFIFYDRMAASPQIQAVTKSRNPKSELQSNRLDQYDGKVERLFSFLPSETSSYSFHMLSPDGKYILIAQGKRNESAVTRTLYAMRLRGGKMIKILEDAAPRSGSTQRLLGPPIAWLDAQPGTEGKK